MLRLALVLAAAWAACAPAHAAVFSVSPVRVELTPDRQAAALTVRNEDVASVTVQIDPMRWSQPSGEDVLEPAADVVVSPPLFTLAPGEEQIVRVGRLDAPDFGTELSYRLIVREIPGQRADGDQGLRVALRISLPLFVAPAAGAAAPALEWRWERKDDAVVLRAANQGTGHVRVSGFTVEPAYGADGSVICAEAFYVLAGGYRDFRLDGFRLPVAARVRATIGGSEVEFDVGGAP